MSRVFAVVAAGLFSISVMHASPAVAAPAPKAPAAAKNAAAADDLAAKVKANLAAEPELKNLTINVTESGGTVTLEGDAPNVIARAKAGEIAKSTQGVHKVNNKIKVAKSESGGSQ